MLGFFVIYLNTQLKWLEYQSIFNFETLNV
jgi:hypothetical protein